MALHYGMSDKEINEIWPMPERSTPRTHSESIAEHLKGYLQDMPGNGAQKKAALLRLVHSLWDDIVVIDPSEELKIVEEDHPDRGIMVHITHEPFRSV